MQARGRVSSWSQGGWGVIDSSATPGGCWVHWSTVRTKSDLPVGQEVTFSFEARNQDGYDYRATDVTAQGSEVAEEEGEHHNHAHLSGDYKTEVRFDFDPPK